MKHQCRSFVLLLLIHISFLYSRTYISQEFYQLNDDQQACQIVSEQINPDQNSSDRELKIFHSISFNIACSKAREISHFSLPMKQISNQSILAEASLPLKSYFFDHTTPQMYAATITNPNCVIPGYTSAYGLYDHLSELSQFACSDPAITKYLTSRMKSYYGRIENVLFDKNGLSHEFITYEHRVALIFIYADFLKEFYCHKAPSVFCHYTCDNQSILQYINFINWNQYNNFNYTASERTKAMRYAGSLNGNYGAALAALEAGDSEKAYAIGKQRVKIQYPGKYVGNWLPTKKEISTFELYPDLQKITLERYSADKAKAEQKRAIKQAVIHRNIIKWCDFYKDENPYVPSDLLQQRHKAAQHSKNNPAFIQEHNLSLVQIEQIDSQLLDKNKKSITLEGCHLQYQLIRESLRVIDAVMNPNISEKMKKAVIDLVNISIFTNKQDAVLATTYVLDTCWAFMHLEEYAAQQTYSLVSPYIFPIVEGIGEGVCESIQGFGNALVVAGYFLGKAIYAFAEHEAVADLCETDFPTAQKVLEKLAEKESLLSPICDVVCEVGHSVDQALFTFAEYEAASDLCEIDFSAGQEALKQLAEKSSLPALWKYAKTLTPKDIARGSTKFVVDTYLLHKTAQVVGLLASRSQPQFLHCVRKGIEAGKIPITADVISAGGSKITNTKFGTAVKNLNQCTNQLETTIVAVENKIIGKVKNKIVGNITKHLNPSLAEDLVEHTVPNSVISKMEIQAGQPIVENTKHTIMQKLGNLAKPDLVMTTPEGIKIFVPDRDGVVGLLQRFDCVEESAKGGVKPLFFSNIELQSNLQITKNATKIQAAKIENKTVVLSEPSIKIENIGVIKSDLLSSIKKHKGHIFSEDHEKKGILALGKNQEAIMDSLYDVIISLDKKGLITEGPNQLRVKINEIDNVEIRCCIKNGEAISINAFISDFGRIFKNFIDTTKV